MRCRFAHYGHGVHNERVICLPKGFDILLRFEVKASHFLEAEALNTSHYQHIQMLSWFHYC